MKTIIANWKSNKTLQEMADWWQVFAHGYPMAKGDDKQVVIAPPAVGITLIHDGIEAAELPNLLLGVQDISPFPAGSYTGAVSTKNLEGLDVEYAIVGHSERRRYFHETHQEVANKVDLALQAEIKPVVCVDVDYLEAQMNTIAETSWPQIIVAYEPLAAIGSGNEEPVEKVIPIIENIRSKYKPAGVIYGGSVSASSVAGYLTICDGVLVATHSLDATDFLSVIRAQ